MRAIAIAAVVAAAGCGPPAWVPAPSSDAAERPADGILRAWRRAAEEREARFREALHPGAGRAARGARLARGGLDDFRDEGERLFYLDAPWDVREPAVDVRPVHGRGAAAHPDATRCAGCHHRGGGGGSGGHGDLAFFGEDGDDVLAARHRLPPMLAGAALLERAAAGRPELQPFGWSPGGARTLRAWVRWSIDTHLGTAASDDEVDAITAFLATLPAPVMEPPPYESLTLRAARGAELFDRIGCGGCHVEALPVEDPVLRLSGGRRIDLRRLLSATGEPPFSVAARTDLRPHHMGPALAEPAARPAAEADWFITPPLWGVASRGPFLHDGRAATLEEAILAHGGEAAPARAAWIALGGDQADVRLYLSTLTRARTIAWTR